MSPFLLPTRPQIELWKTSVIQWDSYNNEVSIVRDLRAYGIEWIMRLRGGKFSFIPIEDYAKEAVHFNRYPQTTVYDYGFPKELTQVHY